MKSLKHFGAQKNQVRIEDNFSKNLCLKIKKKSFPGSYYIDDSYYMIDLNCIENAPTSSSYI